MEVVQGGDHDDGDQTELTVIRAARPADVNLRLRPSETDDEHNSREARTRRKLIRSFNHIIGAQPTIKTVLGS